MHERVPIEGPERAISLRRRKLIIQIPCYNEEQTLPITLADLPAELPGVDDIEILIVDDGSTDRTVEVARAAGVHHIVHTPVRRGLAEAFMAGLSEALRLGADIIVNTDADNQYCASDLGKLIAPILRGEAEIVVGARPIDQIEHFSPLKKKLQHAGSWFVRAASATDIPDAPSGFRALSREAALHINVFDDYTYTLETIIQAGRKGLVIVSVPIHTNRELRPSRLISSVLRYVWRSGFTVLRMFMIYRPRRFFMLLGALPFFAGVILGIRYLVLLAEGTSRSHAPSLILAAILLLAGFSLWIFALIADLLSVNRRLLEDIQVRCRRSQLSGEH